MILLHSIFKALFKPSLWSLFLRIMPYRREYNLSKDVTNKNFLRSFSSFIKIISRYNISKDPVLKRINVENSFHLELDINEYTQCSYYFFPYAHFDLIEIIKKGGHTFIDVGCNVGYFSILGSKYFKNVISFEPHPSTFEKLKKNISLNKFNNIKPLNLGLSKSKSVITLEENPYNLGGSRLVKEIDLKSKIKNKKFQVETISLDSILEEVGNKPTLLKIDVEGFELEVLAGARQFINEIKPDIFIEIACSKKRLYEYMQTLPDGYFYFNKNQKYSFNDLKINEDIILGNDAYLKYEK